MKGLKRSAVIVVVLLVVAVAALQVILKNHLGAVINSQVVPGLEDRLQVDVDVDDASVNLLAGSMNISGIRIGNPEHYNEPSVVSLATLVLDVGIKNLLMGEGADISEVRIDNAVLTLVRNPDGSLNVVDLFRESRGDDSPRKPSRPSEPRPDPDPEKSQDGAGEPLPPILIRDARINTTIRYIDHAISEQPLEIELQNRLTLQNVGTQSTEDSEWGTLSLTGSLAGNRELSVSDLEGRLAPIPDDPMKASFDLSGTISRIDIEPFTNEMRKADFRCEAISLDLDLVCREGEFDSDVSSIRIVAHGFEPLDSLARRLPDAMSRIERLVVPLPIAGPLSKPRLGDFTAALVHAFAALMQENAGSIGKQALEEAVDGRDADELLDKAGLDASEKEQVKDVLKNLLGPPGSD